MGARAMHRVAVLVGLLAASACATAGAGPAWQSWVPGSYDFRTVGGLALRGTVEVGASGPTSLSTSIGKCFEGFFQAIRGGRDRQFIFNCSDKIRVSLQTGARSEDPIVGSASDARTETYIEVTGRTCKEYSEPNRSDDRVCTNWEDITRTVTKRVGRGGMIELIAFRPAAAAPR
jgi:hypothetical protein